MHDLLASLGPVLFRQPCRQSQLLESLRRFRKFEHRVENFSVDCNTARPTLPVLRSPSEHSYDAVERITYLNP